MLYHVYAMSDLGVLDVMFLSGFKSRRCCKGLWVTSGKCLPFYWVEHFVWLLNYIWREVQTVSSDCWNHATRVSGRGCKSTGCISWYSSKGFDLILLYFPFFSLEFDCFCVQNWYVSMVLSSPLIYVHNIRIFVPMGMILTFSKGIFVTELLIDFQG